MSACWSCIGSYSRRDKRVSPVYRCRTSVASHGQGEGGGVYRCDIRSVQQDSGGGRLELRREPRAKGANGATSIGDAWGVKTKAAARGQERQTWGMSEGKSTRVRHAGGSRHGA